ncbi:Biotin carboxylase, partial [Haemophilus influenzae]
KQWRFTPPLIVI